MNGREIYTKLIELRDRSGSTHYERIQLADTLLKDREWVQSISGGGGNESRAIDRLEADCFADLCGLVSLPQLLDLLHHYPNQSDWKRHKFNFRCMWAEWKAKEKPTKAKKPNHKIAKEALSPAEFDILTNGAKIREYEKVAKKVESAEEKITRLEDENRKLREENSSLKDQLKALRQRAKELFAA